MEPLSCRLRRRDDAHRDSARCIPSERDGEEHNINSNMTQSPFVNVLPSDLLRSLFQIGERCTPLGTSASGPTNNSSAVPQPPPQCCYKDCPYVAQACPLALFGPLSGQICGARGRCLDATGTCDCFVGHTGADCSMCVRGYVPTASGLCINPESGKQNGTLAGLEGTQGAGPSGPPSGSGSGSGAAAAAGESSTKLIVGLVSFFPEISYLPTI